VGREAHAGIRVDVVGYDPLSTLAGPALTDDLRLRLDALEIDVSCALSFSRATLSALAAISADAREAIDRCLADEAAIVRIEDLDGSAAVAATLTEARQQIRSVRDDLSAIATRDLERALVESAADLRRNDSAAASRD
jgi:hypothetical protein